MARLRQRLRTTRGLDLLLAVLGILVVWAIYAAAGPASEDKPADTVRVQRGTVLSTVSADGTVEPPRELSLGFEQGGRVVAVLVKEGSRVKRGQLLARVQDGPAAARLQSARENLDSAQARLRQTREGRTVAELTENQRMADQSRVAVSNAERELANARRLRRANVTGLRRALARARVSGEEADLRASQLRLAQERQSVTSLNQRYSAKRTESDRYRDELIDQLDRQRDIRNDSTPDPDALNDVQFRIEALQTRLSRAESEESSALSDLQTAQANVRSYVQDVEGDRVAVRDARRRLGSASDELRNGIASAQQQIDAARNSLDASEAQLRVTLATNAVDEQGARAAEVAADMASVASARATLADARKAFEDTRLRAPVDGVVGKVDSKVGELVGGGGLSSAGLGSTGSDEGDGTSTAGSASRVGTDLSQATGEGSPSGGVITLVQADRLQVKAPFNETETARLRPGDTATVTVDAVPDRKLAARVVAIDPIETVRDNVVTYDVTLVLESRPVGLKPGMTATADVVVDEAADVLTVPKAAVRAPPGATPTVTVITPDGRQVPRLVVTGVQGDAEVQIVGGVGLGDRVLRNASAPPDQGA